MSFTVDRVILSGFEMEYVRFGSGENTLVILPGLSVQSVIPSAAAIEAQYEIFSEDFTVYLFDRRTDLPEVYSIFDMADDTVKAIKALGLSDICIFGASQGGMIAQVTALYYPRLIKKIALGSSACRINRKSVLVIEEWINLAKEEKALDLYLSFGEKVYPKAVFDKYRDAFTDISKTVTRNDLSRFVILASGTVDFDIKDRLGDISCPVLAIGDKSDAVLGAKAAEEIAEAMNGNPDFRMYLYDGFGHAAYDTAPDYKKRLFDFFIE